MKFEDLIGFLISIGAFIFLMIRSAMKKNQARGDEDEEEFVPPVPPPYIPPKPVALQKKRAKLVKEERQDYAQKNLSIVERYSGSSVVSSHYTNMKEAAPYEVIGKNRPSRANQIISQLKSKKNMVILHEIIGTPKGFR